MDDQVGDCATGAEHHHPHQGQGQHAGSNRYQHPRHQRPHAVEGMSCVTRASGNPTLTSIKIGIGMAEAYANPTSRSLGD